MSDVNLILGNDGSNTLQGTAGADLIYGFDPNGPQSQVSSIAATQIASGLDQPVYVIAPPGDTSRLFIIEKGGIVKILDLQTGQVRPTPFLDISNEINVSGELGLLSLAFDTDFATNGKFYIDMQDLAAADTHIWSYQVLANDPNQADLESAENVLTIDRPDFAGNHAGGWIGFGPDGYLYIATGEAGHRELAQDNTNLNGKVLRINVHSDAFPSDSTANYAIPADNMFVGIPGADEIYAMGFRNPWRASFDRGLHDFFIADVGQNTWEEIDLGQLGGNYGWERYEAGADFNLNAALGGGVLTFPIHTYNHNGGSRSVTGGHVYRGESEGLQGDYFFADFSTGQLFTLHFDGTNWVATDRTSQVSEDIGTLSNIASFGEDALGNLYAVSIVDGNIYRIDANIASLDEADNLSGLAGDDMLHGGSGADRILGGVGDDTLIGGRGADSLYGDDGSDLIGGGENADYLNGGTGSDSLDGGAGDDVLQGGDGGDTLIGAIGADTLYGDDNDDMLEGAAGSDYLDGGSGNDRSYGGDGNDSILGGIGSDTLLGEAAADFLFGGDDDDYLSGGDAGDVVSGDTGNDTIDGGDDDDYIDGSAGTDSLYSGRGNDILHGGDDADYLAGQDGSDTMYGENGNDVLDGGGDGQNDYLDGGSGSDIYIFAPGMGHDVVGSFDDGLNPAQDLIYISSTIVPNFTTLAPAIFQFGAHAVINLGGYGGLQINNTDVTTLNIDDFVFF